MNALFTFPVETELLYTCNGHRQKQRYCSSDDDDDDDDVDEIKTVDQPQTKYTIKTTDTIGLKMLSNRACRRLQLLYTQSTNNVARENERKRTKKRARMQDQ